MKQSLAPVFLCLIQVAFGLTGDRDGRRVLWGDRAPFDAIALNDSDPQLADWESLLHH